MVSADWARTVALSADSRDTSPKSAHILFLAVDQEWDRQAGPILIFLRPGAK